MIKRRHFLQYNIEVNDLIACSLVKQGSACGVDHWEFVSGRNGGGIFILAAQLHRTFIYLLPVNLFPRAKRPSLKLPTSHFRRIPKLTLILLTWRIWWAPNNASKWRMGFNLALRGLICGVQRHSFCTHWHKMWQHHEILVDRKCVPIQFIHNYPPLSFSAP
jgi:hypothetical protein